MSARPYVLQEANYQQLRDYRPNVAVLPWGATEAHNLHLPHGTDVIEASEIAVRSAQAAFEKGAKPIVLPAIPFGNNEQQLDQVATISFQTSTALAILQDVARSLMAQRIDRLIILNAHGGNEFKPLARDIQSGFGMLVILINFFQVRPDALEQIFDEPGDHAGEMETSLILHLRPEWVAQNQAGLGQRIPFAIEGLTQSGVWTPRPWSRVHPDTGSGNPAQASAEKGRRYFDTVCEAIAEVLVAVSGAKKGDVPYV